MYGNVGRAPISRSNSNTNTTVPIIPSIGILGFHLIRMLTVHKGNDCAMWNEEASRQRKSPRESNMQTHYLGSFSATISAWRENVSRSVSPTDVKSLARLPSSFDLRGT